MNIIDELKKETAIPEGEYFDLLKQSGLPKKSAGYPIITEEAIYSYLQDMLRAKYGGMKYFELGRTDWDFNRRSASCFYGKRKFNANYRTMNWMETPIQEYQGYPPKHILESIIKHKDNFDALFVVTVDEKTITDPLLIGKNKNDVNRYLIDWWDNDIDVSKLTTE